MAEDVKRAVAAGYDAALERYVAIEHGDQPWPRLRWLQDLLRRVPSGGHILDLGCATGIPTAAEIAKRHRVTGVDISPKQITSARRRIPSGEFLVGDATQVAFPPAAFDAVVSFYTFDHIPRDEHAGLLTDIHAWLRPGGHLLLSIEDSDEPGTVGEWLGVDMFFSMFDASTTRRLVVDAGFEILRSSLEDQLEGEHNVGYVWILARKPT